MIETGFEFGVTPFYFLRHGETDATENEILQGQSETELNAAGRRSAEAAAHALASVELGSIYASPLKRTWLTAKIVSVITGTPLYPLSGLMERHWGIYQGRPKDWRPNLSNPRSAESIEDFTSRILDAMKSIEGPSPVLVVAHSGVFRILCRHAGLATDSRVSVASGLPLWIEPPAGQRQTWRISVAAGA